MLSRPDTIVAPATPAGEGGIAIIRLSGSLAEGFLCRFFRPASGAEEMESHRLYFGHFLTPAGEPVDEVMAVVMRRPRSFTREDVVEVHCHGGPQVVRKILDLFIDAGARLAAPGEFTLRAFLNGRLDLPRAEAVIDLIRSRSDAARLVALRQLEGRLSKAIYSLRDQTVEILALIEAHIDFPEEDIETTTLTRLQQRTAEVLDEIASLLGSFDAGRTLREGLAVLIVGRPNVGKSSLLNSLLGEARAIVTPIPGTTRDTIEENLTLGGMPLRLVDTAGIRHTDDPVEQEGVRRARDKITSADLVLLVLDGSQAIGEEDLFALAACGAVRLLVVVNKGDLPQVSIPPSFAPYPRVIVSAKTGFGMDQLSEAIRSCFQVGGTMESRETALLSDRRHREALVRSETALARFQAGLATGDSPEFLAVDLRAALRAFGEITGETTPDMVLEQIFSRFCIGK